MLFLSYMIKLASVTNSVEEENKPRKCKNQCFEHETCSLTILNGKRAH